MDGATVWRPVFWALIARFGTVCSKANTVSGNGASHAFASFDVVWSGSHGASFPVHFRSRPSITLDRGRRVTARAARGRTLPSRRRTLTRRVSGASCASPPRVSCSRRSASSDQPSRGELAGPVCASPREWSSAPFSVVGSGPHGRVFWCISGRLRTSPRVASFASFGVVGSGPCEASFSVHFRASPRVTARVVVRVVRCRRIEPSRGESCGAFPVAPARHARASRRRPRWLSARRRACYFGHSRAQQGVCL